MPAPELVLYNVEAAVAEKVEAIVRFGAANTPPEDYFDQYVLATERSMDGAKPGAISSARRFDVAARRFLTPSRLGCRTLPRLRLIATLGGCVARPYRCGRERAGELPGSCRANSASWS
jgi:hypothetical protein